MDIDKEEYGFQHMTDEEIAMSVKNQTPEFDDDSSDEEDSEPEKISVTSAEAENMLSQFIKWYETQPDNEAMTRLLLHRLHIMLLKNNFPDV